MRRFLLYMVIWLIPVFVSGQSNVIVEATVDSMMMWVGQQTSLHLEVTCDPDQQVEFPDFRDTIVTGLEVVPPVLTDTIWLNDGKRMSVTRHYTVTCFDSALIYIAPIPVKVNGQEHRSNRLALAFMTYEIPQGEEKNIFGPKENMRTPVQFREIWLPLLLYILSMFAIVGAIFLFRRYKDDKPIIRHIKVESKVPAHKRALDGMEELRRSGLTSADDPKEYYTRLTDLLREYINERFSFNATEMTSDEILEHLRESRDKDSLKELANLLSTSDLVKFAKFKPLIGENDRNLIGAVEFVKETMVEVPEDELMPKEETVVVEKRSKGARTVLLAFTLTVTVAAAILLGIALYKLYFVIF
ncbi:MAG: hypothetical protein IKS24_09350 [Bacteroidaceae bacterium]|nr:hypothetical protein [Bacteroidaceae bacterium]